MPTNKSELAPESGPASSNPLDAVPVEEMPFDGAVMGPRITSSRAQASY